MFDAWIYLKIKQKYYNIYLFFEWIVCNKLLSFIMKLCIIVLKMFKLENKDIRTFTFLCFHVFLIISIQDKLVWLSQSTCICFWDMLYKISYFFAYSVKKRPKKEQS